jgi:bifunctional N-acetylglucosamine-1-phosphate-uridyltransferase/glucosamine-1-phosphate-acetyltransferase GlmU-like protein
MLIHSVASTPLFLHVISIVCAYGVCQIPVTCCASAALSAPVLQEEQLLEHLQVGKLGTCHLLLNSTLVIGLQSTTTAE